MASGFPGTALSLQVNFVYNTNANNNTTSTNNNNDN